MSTYLDEKRHRIEQFAQYLRLMGLRRHKIAKRDCFIIFDESAPEDAQSRQCEESAAIKTDCLANGSSASGETGLADLPPANWSPVAFRYIQLAFRRDCFYLELPNHTVFPKEAEQILRQRPGFYYARNRQDLRWVRANWKDIVKWNPLQKVYLYRDEESAAEDMAFIFFQLWNFPVDSPLYVKATLFHTGQSSEWGKPIE